MSPVQPTSIVTRRVLGARLESAASRDASWRGMLESIDLASICITPEESARQPELACRLRAAVLLRTYRQDYHTDTQDIARLAQAVRDGRERVLFWGEPAVIADVRQWFAGEGAASALDAVDLGTATTLDMSGIYGNGYAELSRTGSVSRGVAATAPIVSDLRRLLNGHATPFGTQHTFVALPRNRRTSPEVRGGAAIQRLHVRDIGSAFWGVAPWYRMQGGFIEVLDYREIYREPEAVAALHQHVKHVWVTSSEAERYVRSLLALNFGEDAAEAFVVHAAHRHGTVDSHWVLAFAAPPALRGFCPAIVRPSNSSDGQPLEPLIAEAADAAAIAVFVPLEDPAYAAVQYWLDDRGFRVTAVIPAKPDPEGRTPLLGVWCRAHPAVPWAAPYYIGDQVEGPQAAILGYVRALCAEGKGSG